MPTCRDNVERGLQSGTELEGKDAKTLTREVIEKLKPIRTLLHTVHYTVKSSNKEGTQVLTYKTTDGVEKMMPNKSWTLNISPKDNNGSLSITITIDENTNDRPIEIVVPTDWLN